MTEPLVQPAQHQAIYRRWRAQTFAQMVGQEAIVETLRNAVRTGRVAHAILFVGPRGTGKTSLARILAKALNCTNLQDGDACDACPSCVAIREGRAMDLIEIDAASNRGIDAIRDLRDRVNYAPTDLRRKVYILDEAHQITRDAWNALLKSLEEPPDFVVFMFASTHPQEFPPAILSRLQRFDVRRLTPDEIAGKLRRILDADGRTATPEAVALIARLAAGGMRDAESMLDQLLASATDGIDEARVRELLGLADAETVAAFVGAMVDGDARAGIRLLDGLEDRGRDLRGFLDQVIKAIRSGIVGTAGPASAVTNHPIAVLAAAARRLAAIDPSRAGVGGLRLQLELALLAGDDGPIQLGAARIATAQPAPGPRSRPAEPATTKPPREPAAAVERGAPDRVAPPESSPPTPVAEPGGTDSGAGRRTSRARAAATAGPADAEVPAAATTPAATTPPADGTPAPVPAAEPPQVSDDLALLRDRWTEIVARISTHPPTKPLIVACRPVSVEGAVVTLGFPEDKGFLRQVAERRKSVLEEHISAVMGRAVAVRCVATNIDVVPDLRTDEEAAWILAEAHRLFDEDGAGASEVG